LYGPSKRIKIAGKGRNTMKMQKILTGGVVCFSLIFSGVLLAEDGQKPEGGQRQGDRPGGQRNMEIKTNCPDCQSIVDEIKAKVEEMKKLREEEQAKLEELKKTDPKKYDELMAKRDSNRKEMEAKMKDAAAKRENAGGKEGGNPDNKDNARQKGPRGPMNLTPEQLEKMKIENPEMYKAYVEREKIFKAVRELRDKLKTCEENCKSK